MQKTIICVFAPGLKIDAATLYNNDSSTHIIAACFFLSSMLAKHGVFDSVTFRQPSFPVIKTRVVLTL